MSDEFGPNVMSTHFHGHPHAQGLIYELRSQNLNVSTIEKFQSSKNESGRSSIMQRTPATYPSSQRPSQPQCKLSGRSEWQESPPSRPPALVRHSVVSTRPATSCTTKCKRAGPSWRSSELTILVPVILQILWISTSIGILPCRAWQSVLSSAFSSSSSCHHRSGAVVI